VGLEFSKEIRMTSFCRLLFAMAGTLLVGPLACGSVTHFGALEPFVIVGRPLPPLQEERKPLPRLELRDNRIEIEQKVQFELNTANIQESSFSLLHDIADVLRKNPRVKRVSIEGHASAEGDAFHNRCLSNLRSRAVIEHLIRKEHIALDRLVSRDGAKRSRSPATTRKRDARRIVASSFSWSSRM